MKSPTKVMLVAAGYLVALVIAAVVVDLYIAATDGPGRQAYSGMVAFGDSILFLGVFTVAAIPATGAALFFLRPYRMCWLILLAGALVIATTGVAAFATYLVPSSTRWGSLLGTGSELPPLRILLAPPLAIAFFLSLLFAPTRGARIAFLGASVIEAVVFVWGALLWFQPA